MRDDRSDPNTTVRLVQALIDEEDVHAVICCSREESVRRVAEQAGDWSTPILSLTYSPVIGDPAQNYWLFGLEPSTREKFRRIILTVAEQGGNRVALMTLDNTFGEEAVEAMRTLLAPGGMQLVASEQYAPEVEVLTPEALWVASRQPSAVVVWGFSRDTSLALRALNARGYEGLVYVHPENGTSGLGLSALVSFEAALTVTDPVSVADTLPISAPTYTETRRYASAMRRAGMGANISVAGAYAWDAMLILEKALEQTMTFGVALDDTAQMRSALRDGIIASSVVTGAAAEYSFTESDRHGAEGRSLVVARVTSGRLQPLR